MKSKLVGVAAAALVAVAMIPSPALAGLSCPITLPQGSDPVDLNPADFVSEIDNEFWPMLPGTHWVYSESDTEGTHQIVRVHVTSRTRTIEGIEATVVHDVVREHGELVEDTFDWYAQDVCGNLWYMGEATVEYEDGEPVTTAGSWEHGVDGALAGVIVPADPAVGMTYRQEYYAGEAEDAAEILSLDEKAQVPYGTFRHVLLTKDFTPLHPRVLEYKLYAKGVGPVLAIGISGGSDREELLRFEAP
jgi:hypothetical protein